MVVHEAPSSSGQDGLEGVAVAVFAQGGGASSNEATLVVTSSGWSRPVATRSSTSGMTDRTWARPTCNVMLRYNRSRQRHAGPAVQRPDARADPVGGGVPQHLPAVPRGFPWNRR